MESLPLTPYEKLNKFLPVWRELRQRHNRSPGDAELKQSWQAASDRMDVLVEAFVRGIIVVSSVEEYTRITAEPIINSEAAINLENFELGRE